MASVYDVGDSIRLAVHITVADVDTDPTALALKVKDPSGVITSYAIGDLVKDSVGDFHKDVTASSAGTWYVRFAGTAPAEGAGESSFWVQPSHVV